jgi:hypothetical protein
MTGMHLGHERRVTMNRDRGTKTERRSFKWVVLVAVGLAGLVAVGAASGTERSPASPFELVVQGREEPVLDGDIHVGWQLVGTFTSRGPFCQSGTVGYQPYDRDALERYTCTDGSGSLMLRIAYRPAGYDGYPGGDWTIVEASGLYAGLRGEGTFIVQADEFPDFETGTFPFRATFEGFADADAVAPSVAFTSANATKVRRSGTPTYTIRVGLSLRDDVEANTVAYTLRVKEGKEHPRDRQLWEIGWREGSTASGSAPLKLRVFPSSKRVRSVELQLTASDPVGNEVTLTRWVNLPR